MSSDRSRILKMLADGKITVEQAERLLDAIAAPDHAEGRDRAVAEDHPVKRRPKYLRVLVAEANGNCVNVRVPLELIRAGLKLGSVVPDSAVAKANEALRQKGIHLDLGGLESGALADLVEQLAELTVDVAEGGSAVRVFCE